MLYVKYGSSITEKFLKPYNEKLYSTSLESLDYDAMGRFFPDANIDQIISNMLHNVDDSYNKEFYYPINGADTYTKALLKDLKTEKVHLNSEVLRIDIHNKIVYTSQNKYSYNHLINTSPLPNLIKFTGMNVSEKKLNQFSHSKVLVLNLGFDKKSIFKDIHWVYVPSKELNFYRYGFYDNILDSDKLSLYVEISFEKSAIIDINKELDLTLLNLKKIGVTKDLNLISYSSVIMDPAYVHIKQDNQDFKKEIKKI